MKIEDVKLIAVLGAGDMGHGIAQAAALAGYKVNLRDINETALQKGMQRIYESLEKMASKEKITLTTVQKIKKELLNPVVSLQEAVKNADFIIEAIPEIFELKIDTFREVDKYAPERACIASNSSCMSITAMGQATLRPDKVLGLHFFNPVVLMKLVEVIKTNNTSEETIEIAIKLSEKMAKFPIIARKDTTGFIANRIMAPIGPFLFCLLDIEKLSYYEMDATVKHTGSPMGFFELMDYTGLDCEYNSEKYFANNLHSDYEPSKTLAELVEDGYLGKKTGKGFYDWSNGRPEIDATKYTDKFNVDDLKIIKGNEACKLVDEGVCSFKDTDIAIKYGFNEKFGAIEEIQKYEPGYLVNRLNELAKKYNKEIFKPAKSIIEGKYIN